MEYEVNACLECAGLNERIDRRSFADQGKDEQPMIHEGVIARAMEKKELVSDRCEMPSYEDGSPGYLIMMTVTAIAGVLFTSV